MTIRFVLQLGTQKVPRASYISNRYCYMTMGPVRGEEKRSGSALSIALIYVDDANFEFPTDVPSGALCSGRYVFHESHDTLVAQNQQETVEAGLDR